MLGKYFILFSLILLAGCKKAPETTKNIELSVLDKAQINDYDINVLDDSQLPDSKGPVRQTPLIHRIPQMSMVF